MARTYPGSKHSVVLHGRREGTPTQWAVQPGAPRINIADIAEPGTDASSLFNLYVGYKDFNPADSSSPWGYGSPNTLTLYEGAGRTRGQVAQRAELINQYRGWPVVFSNRYRFDFANIDFQKLSASKVLRVYLRKAQAVITPLDVGQVPTLFQIYYESDTGIERNASPPGDYSIELTFYLDAEHSQNYSMYQDVSEAYFIGLYTTTPYPFAMCIGGYFVTDPGVGDQAEWDDIGTPNIITPGELYEYHTTFEVHQDTSDDLVLDVDNNVVLQRTRTITGEVQYAHPEQIDVGVVIVLEGDEYALTSWRGLSADRAEVVLTRTIA